MRIASWNVNSIRARLDHLDRWLKVANPDVLCLQETKVIDSDFPDECFARLGYETVYVGQKTYNGVAILSRHTITEVMIGHAESREDDAARLIAGTVLGVRILSAYVPNGKTLDSPSYVEKLEWLARLQQTLDSSCDPNSQVVLCGDFNVARDERDVFDPELMAGKIHFSESEHRSMDRMLSFGLKDTFRQLHQEGEQFSWWDYRMGAFRRNRGLRIDYIFGSQKISDNLVSATIDTEPRRWERPSDHAPVVIDFDLEKR